MTQLYCSGELGVRIWHSVRNMWDNETRLKPQTITCFGKYCFAFIATIKWNKRSNLSTSHTGSAKCFSNVSSWSLTALRFGLICSALLHFHIHDVLLKESHIHCVFQINGHKHWQHMHWQHNMLHGCYSQTYSSILRLCTCVSMQFWLIQFSQTDWIPRIAFQWF